MNTNTNAPMATPLTGKRGGKRPGAGRPRLDNPKVMVAFRADKDTSAFLKGLANRSGFINEAVRTLAYSKYGVTL